MKMIQPNCRVQFTAEDIDFILNHLGATPRDEGLVRLLADEESRDAILDDEMLFKALLEETGCLRVSSHFYFYVLVRHTLKKAGLDDLALADYVAELLAEFSHAERTDYRLPGSSQPGFYFFEMLQALQSADEQNRFFLRAYMGNYALFMAGVFPERLKHRAERRGAPGLDYFGEMGRSSFRIAGEHRLARKFEVGPIFNTLAEHFEPTRFALNDLADRVMFIAA